MTGDDYRPCVAIYPSGQWRSASVKYIRLMSVEQALTALQNDLAAWVAVVDAEAVLNEWNNRADKPEASR